jgi:glycosyltransferase involved in cell wall biosynthesis
MEDIGSMRPQKFLILFGHCLHAIWCRFRYGARVLYYVPAPGKQSAMWRDWLVMSLCRPFFDQVVLHWHASGMARWLQTAVQMRTRRVTYRTLGKANLSIVLSDYGRLDAEKLLPSCVTVVGNGIPDPCPEFSEVVLPRRRARFAARRLLNAGQPIPPEVMHQAGRSPQLFQVLFMGHCTREKGLFEALEGVVRARQRLGERGCPISVKLVVAGAFMKPEEEEEFRSLCAAHGREVVEHVGFVSGEPKRQLLIQSDLFCFPSHLESFGLVLAEAMAFGLPIITTRAGALPEVMAHDHRGLVDVKAPDQIADKVLQMMDAEPYQELRHRFETQFTVEKHLTRLASSLKSLQAGVAVGA